MEDLQRNYCVYHQSQLVTNFCKERTCLMPLCPTCICSHLDLHISGGKAIPQLSNINEILTNCSREIKGLGERFEESKLKLNSVERSVNEYKQCISKMIHQARVQVREVVDASFQNLERELQSSILKQSTSLGLHLPQFTNSIEKRILDASSVLREMNFDLKCDKSLSTLIDFYRKGKVSLQKQLTDVQRDIRNNEEFSPVVSMDVQTLNRVRQAVSQVVNLRFNFPFYSTPRAQSPGRNNAIINQRQSGMTSRIIHSIRSNRSPSNKLSPNPLSLINNRDSLALGSPCKAVPKCSALGSPISSKEGLSLITVSSQNQENRKTRISQLIHH